MLYLIKFEINKIITKKPLWILMIISLWIAISPVFYELTAIKPQDVDTIKKENSILSNYEGAMITKDGIEQVKKDSRELTRKNSKELTAEEYIRAYPLPANYVLDINPTYIVNKKELKIEGIKEEIERLEKEGSIDTFEYKNLKFVDDLISKKDSPKFYIKNSWRSATDFKTIAPLISTLIALGISTIFTNDYQCNSASIILSSKNGKDKLVIAKIISSIVFATISFVIINISSLLYPAISGFKGWDVPLNYLSGYEATPFNMRIINFYIIALLVSFIGVILFTLLSVLISLLSKNNMISILISLGIYHVPGFLARFMPSMELSQLLKQFNISELMTIQGIFGDIYTYNIFGNPVLYSSLFIGLAIISIPIVTCLIIRWGKTQTI